MKKNVVIAVIIVLLALAIVSYQFNKQYPTYPQQEWSLSTSINSIPNIIKIKASEFYPKSLTVEKGEKITWVNEDTSPHTVTSNDSELNSAIIPPNQTYSHVFDKEGKFSYNCSLRPVLYGDVIVIPKSYN